MSPKKILVLTCVLGWGAGLLLAQAESNSYQTISGNVSSSGNFTSTGDSVQTHQIQSYAAMTDYDPQNYCNRLIFQNNKLYVSWICSSIFYADGLYEDGIRAYMIITFDDQGNVLDKKVGWGGNLVMSGPNFCVGDDAACKNYNWASLRINTSKTSCSFSCDQKNTFMYSIRYENNLDGGYKLINPDKVYKCKEIKSVFSPDAEWVGTLTHTCGYTPGVEKVYTIDTMSPPTDLLACNGIDECLAAGTEYPLTDNTFGKGVQRVPADFVNSVQNSLSPGSDSTLHCSGDVCIPYAAGPKKLKVSIPETSFEGQCRGNAVNESIDGHPISTPEINLKTSEAKVPATSSTLDFNVVNLPPEINMSLSKNDIFTEEAIQLTTDISDPDTCSDKISRMSCTCADSNGNSNNCYFWPEGGSPSTPGQYIQDFGSQQNSVHTVTQFKVTQAGDYNITCEGWDNDTNATVSGTVKANLLVTNCQQDGSCNEKCPFDPDCCNVQPYADAHPDCHCGDDGICNEICPKDPGITIPKDPDCCQDPYCISGCKWFGYPHCEMPLGECWINRLKPSLGESNTVRIGQEVLYQATVSGGTNPASYTWYCDKDSGETATNASTEMYNTQICTYSTERDMPYEPKAIVKYQYGEIVHTIDCPLLQGQGVVVKEPKKATSCKVNLGIGELFAGDKLKAKIKANPSEVLLNSLSVTWRINGVPISLRGDEELDFPITAPGTIKIEATAKNFDNTTVDCEPASTNAKEKMHWGQ